MNAKPIIFNGPMVRALLDGRKSQTRRVVKPQPSPSIEDCYPRPDGRFIWLHLPRGRGVGMGEAFPCPYGQPGDYLWTRETWGLHDQGFDTAEESSLIVYRADDARAEPRRWRPSIHMPRWASRLTLRITDVRVEWVQGISEDAAKSEGVGPYDVADISDDALFLLDAPLLERWNPHRNSFALLWDSINAKRGYGWDANPWCWVLSFDVIHANVDDVLNERVAA